jgi:hypothetical protein
MHPSSKVSLESEESTGDRCDVGEKGGSPTTRKTSRYFAVRGGLKHARQGLIAASDGEDREVAGFRAIR